MVRMRTWSVDYRMPPDHRYPGRARRLHRGVPALLEVQAPERIVVGGGSAGGEPRRRAHAPRPRRGPPVARGPRAVDAGSGSHRVGRLVKTNLGIDPVLRSSLVEWIALYAGDHDLSDPYLSPLFGDFSPPFPPTFVQAGTRDLFLSNAVRLHRRLPRRPASTPSSTCSRRCRTAGLWCARGHRIGEEVRRFVASHLSTLRKRSMRTEWSARLEERDHGQHHQCRDIHGDDDDHPFREEESLVGQRLS